MLIHIATHQPQMLWAVVQGTPPWVWALLAGLSALGASQLRPRQAGVPRVLLAPLALTVFSAWGLWSAFGSGPAAQVLALWLLAAALCLAASLWLHRKPPPGAHYDKALQRFHLPGSAAPLLLIWAIFCTKYLVGVELALQPPLAQDTPFALQIAALYGVFNGLLLARVARLWHLAQQTPLRA